MAASRARACVVAEAFLTPGPAHGARASMVMELSVARAIIKGALCSFIHLVGNHVCVVLACVCAFALLYVLLVALVGISGTRYMCLVLMQCGLGD